MVMMMMMINQCLYVGKLLNSMGLDWVPGPLVTAY